MNNYHQILGITPDATLDQIKKAYRKRAKLLHPDMNKASTANEDFITLNEAYEFLLQTAGNNPNRFKRAQEQADKRASYQKDWAQKEREKARARAQEYARMKYEAYIKSDIYKTTEAINVIVDFFATMLILLFVIGLPVFSYLEHGPIAIFISALIILPTSPLWFRFLVRTFDNIHIGNFFLKKKATLQSKMLKLTFLFIFNLIIFFKIALNTLIEFHWIIAIYGFAFGMGFIFSKTSKGKFHKYFIRYDFAPGIVSLLFMINFFVSSNPKEESYWFNYDYNSRPICISIELENNAYQQYKGMRFFGSKETLSGKGYIKYTFKDGLLGFKTAHDIEFLYKLPEP